jgi:hypothetical protein
MFPSVIQTMPAAKKSRKGVGGRPKLPEPMVSIASLKGKQAFADWFERLATFCRLTGTATLEHALIELAKARGFPEPPPER